MKTTAVGQVEDPGKQQVIAYINKLSAFLSAKKKKAILEADFQKIEREIRYVRFGVEETQRRIDEENSLLADLTPRIVEIRSRLKHLRQEKQPLADEYNRLLDIEKNVQNKCAEIESRKAAVLRLAEETKAILEQIDQQWKRISRQKAEIRENRKGVSQERERLKRLEEEVEVMGVTKDLMAGQAPQGVDIQEFPSLQTPRDQTEEYTSEVRIMMDQMEADIGNSNENLVRVRKRAAELESEKQTLESKLKTLSSQVDPASNKERMTREVTSLGERKEALTRELSTLNESIENMRPKVAEYNEKLFTLRNEDDDLNERLVYLRERKAYIAGLEDAEMEMDRMRQRIDQAGVDTAFREGYLAVIERVSKMSENLQGETKTAFESYRMALSELKQSALLKHSLSYFGKTG